MLALLVASLLASPVQQWSPGKPIPGTYDQVPLSHYFTFDNARQTDFRYLEQQDVFRGGLTGVNLRGRLLINPGTVHVEPGLMLVPSDIAYQRLLILWGYDFPYGCGEPDAGDVSPDLIASLAPGGQTTTAPQRRPTLRVACMEMTKKMPDNMRFHIEPCPDPVLAKLCAIGKDAPIRGLYDQPRIWIYTDHATIADCNAHLLKPVTPAMYLRALWEDASAGAIDLGNAAFKPCIDPVLVRGLNAPAAAKLWLVSALDQINPEGLANEVQTDGASLQPQLSDGSRDQSMADLLDALAGSKTPAVVSGLPKFISDAIPADRKDAILAKCKHKFAW